MSVILSAWTVIVALLFPVIVYWAWRGGNQADFNAAAKIPLDEDDHPQDPQHG
jgi:cbb3-type cytochrome oxidase subunit 3